MLEVRDISKSYGSQMAVKKLSFSVKKGEILAFLGPNGAGKSTTMKIITTYLPPDSGSVSLDGFEISTQALEVRKRIGYLPEHNPLYYDMYISEFLSWMCRIHKIGKREGKKCIKEVIEQTGLGPELHKKIGMLSKGYKQRVGIAQALLHNPSLLILDEPVSGLDPNQIVEIRSLIKEIGKEKAVVFSSHILSEAEAIADRILIIKNGELLTDTQTKELNSNLKNETIIEVEFDREGFDLAAILSIEGVKSVNALSSTNFEIITDENTEIRKTLFEETVKQKLVIYSLNKKESTLEDVFRELTQGNSEE